MIKKEFFYASAAGGVPVYAVEWLPDSRPQAVLQIAQMRQDITQANIRSPPKSGSSVVKMTAQDTCS